MDSADAAFCAAALAPMMRRQKDFPELPRRHSSPVLRKDESRATPMGLAPSYEWEWHPRRKSHEVRLYGSRRLTALFHPNWSNGTAGVRGTCVLNDGTSRFYWELKVTDRIFGTSMMFGVATRRSRLHAESFTNLIGEDDHGWGLSHKGLLWHNGLWTKYTSPFPENKATTIGMLYDQLQGTLTYYRDGVCLGVAFTGLNLVTSKIYPMACSTAAKTEMTLANQRREFLNLQERCRAVINGSIARDDVHLLHIPTLLKRFLLEGRGVKRCGDLATLGGTSEDNAYEDSSSDESGDEMDVKSESKKAREESWSSACDSICGAFDRGSPLSTPPPLPHF